MSRKAQTPKKTEPPQQAGAQAIIAALIKQRNNLANEVAVLEARLNEMLAAQPDIPPRPEITD